MQQNAIQYNAQQTLFLLLQLAAAQSCSPACLSALTHRPSPCTRACSGTRQTDAAQALPCSTLFCSAWLVSAPTHPLYLKLEMALNEDVKVAIPIALSSWFIDAGLY